MAPDRATGVFFALAPQSPSMSAFRKALGDLPDAVFVDLLESDDEYLLVVDLPGVTADSLDLSAADGRLEIEARREKDLPAGHEFLREDRPLFLDAEIPLPPDATGADARATIERGVLEVSLPKREAPVEQPIPVEER